MAADIFAKIGDIKGESTDAKHKDEVEVLAWSWGVSHAGARVGRRRRRRQGRAFPTSASPTTSTRLRRCLMRACATGEHIKEATVTAGKRARASRST